MPTPTPEPEPELDSKYRRTTYLPSEIDPPSRRSKTIATFGIKNGLGMDRGLWGLELRYGTGILLRAENIIGNDVGYLLNLPT